MAATDVSCGCGAATPRAARSERVSRALPGGHGRAGRHPPHPGDAGRRSRRPVELQGRQVRLVQRRDQRQAAADVHDADGHLRSRARRSPSRRCKTFPIDPRPRHRRLVQLREGQDGPARSRRSRSEADGTRRMQQEDVERGQEFRKCIECFLCQNVCHVIRDHQDNKQAFAGPRFFVRLRRARDAPARHATTGSELAQDAGRARLLQHHEVLHRGLPRAHPHHRQRHHSAQGADRHRVPRSRRLALAQADGQIQRDAS